MDKSLIGKKIKEARITQGLTQAQLAEMVSLHEKHISRIEAGKYLPTLENIIKIFKILKIELSMCNIDVKIPIEENVIKMEFMRLINNSSDNELEFYLGLLKQAQKGLGKFKASLKV